MGRRHGEAVVLQGSNMNSLNIARSVEDLQLDLRELHGQVETAWRNCADLENIMELARFYVEMLFEEDRGENNGMAAVRQSLNRARVLLRSHREAVLKIKAQSEGLAEQLHGILRASYAEKM